MKVRNIIVVIFFIIIFFIIIFFISTITHSLSTEVSDAIVVGVQVQHLSCEQNAVIPFFVSCTDRQKIKAMLKSQCFHLTEGMGLCAKCHTTGALKENLLDNVSVPMHLNTFLEGSKCDLHKLQKPFA